MLRKGGTVGATVCLCAALLTAVTGCTSDADPGGQKPQTLKTSPSQSTTNFAREREIGGQTDTGTLWALFYHRKAGKKVKTLWRMSGTGELTIRATGPNGQKVQPVWGPETHTGSTWKRPGDEWGVGWVIPGVGVWTFWVERTDGTSGTVKVNFS